MDKDQTIHSAGNHGSYCEWKVTEVAPLISLTTEALAERDTNPTWPTADLLHSNVKPAKPLYMRLTPKKHNWLWKSQWKWWTGSYIPFPPHSWNFRERYKWFWQDPSDSWLAATTVWGGGGRCPLGPLNWQTRDIIWLCYTAWHCSCRSTDLPSTTL